MTTGEKILFERNRAGLSRKELALKCGMSESQIRKYEVGERRPKLEALYKLSSALQVPTGTFFETELYAEETQDVAEVIDLLKKIDNRLHLDDIDIQGMCCWIDLQRLCAAAIEDESLCRPNIIDTISAFLDVGYAFTPEEFNLIKWYSKLNEDGQNKAIERIQELAEIERYRRAGFDENTGA